MNVHWFPWMYHESLLSISLFLFSLTFWPWLKINKAEIIPFFSVMNQFISHQGYRTNRFSFTLGLEEVQNEEDMKQRTPMIKASGKEPKLPLDCHRRGRLTPDPPSCRNNLTTNQKPRFPSLTPPPPSTAQCILCLKSNKLGRLKCVSQPGGLRGGYCSDRLQMCTCKSGSTSRG